MSVHVRRLAYDDGDALVALIDRARDRRELLAFSPWMERGFRPEYVGPMRAAVAVDESGFVGVVIPELKCLVVEPVRRMQGIGTRLAETGLVIEREQDHETLYLGVLPGDPRGEGFLRATGFTYHSSVFDLELSAKVAVDGPPTLPEGFAIRPFDRERDVDAWTDAHNEAFAEHPTPVRFDPLDVRRWLGDPAFRDDDTILLVAPDGSIAGFVATDPQYRPDGSLIPRAEIWSLGVVPVWRGRGLGRVLLRVGVAWLRALGADTVALSVSARNEGALALYEHEGFVRSASRDRWARRVDGMPAPAPEPPPGAGA
ncbi:MAG TPA: GNAT family N-acetyltransferase [Candidatus Limnocylindrales bacterium]|nr:GNAT family N-acetyltransferase [Candidatus Limnocylindrales bacterium]